MFRKILWKRTPAVLIFTRLLLLVSYLVYFWGTSRDHILFLVVVTVWVQPAPFLVIISDKRKVTTWRYEKIVYCKWMLLTFSYWRRLTGKPIKVEHWSPWKHVGISHERIYPHKLALYWHKQETVFKNWLNRFFPVWFEAGQRSSPVLDLEIFQKTSPFPRPPRLGQMLDEIRNI